MGYVNFKEERYKATNQLKKRRENNKNLFEQLVKSRELPNTYNPDKEYSFKEFNDKHFGGGKILAEKEFIEIANSDIICSIFTNCTFGNIKFKDCSFIGCKFNECNFESGGVLFENCTFFKEESEKKPSLNRFDNFSCEFYKCNIYSKFDGCILSYLIFDKCLIHNTFFNLSDMSSLMAKKTERSVLDFTPKMASYLYWATCGYEERAINSIVFSLIIMIVFGILYSIFGIEIDDTNTVISLMRYNIYNYREIFACLKEGIILSVNLFSGVGANESIPVNLSEIIASFEIVFGVIMMGIGTGTVVRKLVR